MHNEAKSEKCLAIISAERVDIFQASLKLVGEEVGDPNSLNKANKCFNIPWIKLFM